MGLQLLILYYSAYGHMHRMCEAAKEGAESVEDVTAMLRRVPETLPQEILEAAGVAQAQGAFVHVSVANLNGLEEAGAVLFGVPPVLVTCVPRCEHSSMVLALCGPRGHRPILLVVRVVLTRYPDALLMERQPLQEVE